MKIILIKIISLLLFSGLYWSACTLLTAWLYRMAPSREVLHWKSWEASFEMAAIMTILNVLWWIKPLFLKSPISLWKTTVFISVLSAFSTGCYLSLVFWLGPDSPMLTIFGYAAANLFREDMGAVYAIVVAPIMAILSGVISCAMFKVVAVE